MARAEYGEDIVDRLIEQLAVGRSLKSICAEPDMPERFTVQRWMRADNERAARIIEAREIGFHHFAEETLEQVAAEEDPHRAKVILSSRQWYLGKVSQGFAEKPVVGLAVNVDADSTFDALARLLEGTSARLSSGRQSTYVVDEHGTPRPIDAGGGLPNLAADGGQGVREDKDRS